jgi:hypothetical protein
LVTVLTPATTVTVGEDFIQTRRRVNTSFAVICGFPGGKMPRKFCCRKLPICYVTEAR